MSALGKAPHPRNFFPSFFKIPSTNKAKSENTHQNARTVRMTKLKSRSYKATTSIIYAQLHSKRVIYKPNFNIN